MWQLGCALFKRITKFESRMWPHISPNAAILQFFKWEIQSIHAGFPICRPETLLLGPRSFISFWRASSQSAALPYPLQSFPWCPSYRGAQKSWRMKSLLPYWFRLPGNSEAMRLLFIFSTVWAFSKVNYLLLKSHVTFIPPFLYFP